MTIIRSGLSRAAQLGESGHILLYALGEVPENSPVWLLETLGLLVAVTADNLTDGGLKLQTKCPSFYCL